MSSSNTAPKAYAVDPTTQYGQELLSSCLNGLPSFEESSYDVSRSSDSSLSSGNTATHHHDRPPVKYIQPPNPEWKFGESVQSTKLGEKWMEGAELEDNWVHYDTEKEDTRKIYTLMISGIQPRPVAFVSSVSVDGEENIAPFSFFQALSPSPPIIMISALNAPRVKDTTANIQATKDFTVNIISLPWIVQANAASIDAPRHISEWEVSGLTKEPSTHVRAPRVKESAFSLECILWDKYDIVHPDTGMATSTATFGLIKCIHVRKDVLNARGLPDPAKLQTISRLGDISYGLVTEAFRLPRPSWNADGEFIEKELKERRKSEPSSSLL
ncbi:hypothetical protein GYMLUDRAFT_45273 [Collybiopsis luxurians FD-317 M1]|uniref:Flavin reductase like domain-containing protein n=1 Tax=Collybiopsis luxurians FD-317 M1 TaxID=944289 RepID=A0A0D0C778_9AGAR|nr:hypothetical protein GYMLUDRAFT_45273 [Collybiopsis luxurians FD-317 M1]